MSELDRSKLNQALSKAIAYKQYGKDLKAQLWSLKLIQLLDTMDILDQTVLADRSVELSDL